MNKIWLIFRREYLTMVRKWTFLLSTFLVPIGLAAIFGVQILAALMVEKESYTVLYNQEELTEITSQIENSENLTFEKSDESEETLRARVLENEEEIYISIAPVILDKSKGTVRAYSSDNLSKPVLKELRSQLEKAVAVYKRDQAGISAQQLADSKFELEVQNTKITEKGESSNNANLAMGIGYAVCFLMYMLMGIYGSILMQGIIEEKSNRIVEIIVSSVEPFKLLMGKTLAIASVGITQFLMWAVLSGVVMTIMIPIVANSGVDPNAMSSPGMDVEAATSTMAEVMFEIQNFDWTVLWFFPIYFLGGFFLYGSLLAGAGSAVDNIQDAQQFTFPITMLLILPILFVSNIIQNPGGDFAVFASLFPFFSPMSMLVRMSMVDVPWWQIGLSLVILIGSFAGCIWVAGKIYRTGILMYGKKPSFKEVFRWITYRGNG